MSQLVLCGNVQVSTQAMQVLCEASIPVVYLSMGHWFYGISHGIHLRNAYDRVAQFRVAGEPAQCLAFARQLVADKAENQRTLLRRNAPAEAMTDRALGDIDDLIERIAADGFDRKIAGDRRRDRGGVFRQVLDIAQATRFRRAMGFRRPQSAAATRSGQRVVVVRLRDAGQGMHRARCWPRGWTRGGACIISHATDGPPWRWTSWSHSARPSWIRR